MTARWRSFPLVEVRSLPDGGKAYVYDFDGEPAWTNIPPPGFDASAATADQLVTYGYPEKPVNADSDAVAAWTSSVARRKFIQPPASMYGVPLVRFGTFNSLNWAGYYTKSATFTKAYLTYTFADIYGPPTPPCQVGGAVAAWAGLGGRFTGELAQNGTAIGTPGLGYYQGWWEILPAAPVAVPIYGTYNKSFTVFTTRNANGTFTFQWFNNYTDDSYTVTRTSTRYDGSSADFIIERPRISGGYEAMSQLINPQSFRGDANANPINTYSYDKVNMYNAAGQQMFSTSGLQSDGKSFTTTQLRCT